MEQENQNEPTDSQIAEMESSTGISPAEAVAEFKVEDEKVIEEEIVEDTAIIELTKKVEQQDNTIETLLKANEALMTKMDHVVNNSSTQAPKNFGMNQQQAKEGYKFVKVRVLADDGDIEYGIIQVPKTDKRRAVDPNAGMGHNRTDVGKGNPMSDAKTGQNDIVVTGI